MQPSPLDASRACAEAQGWTATAVAALFARSLSDLLERAHGVDRAHHDPNADTA